MWRMSRYVEESSSFILLPRARVIETRQNFHICHTLSKLIPLLRKRKIVFMDFIYNTVNVRFLLDCMGLFFFSCYCWLAQLRQRKMTELSLLIIARFDYKFKAKLLQYLKCKLKLKGHLRSGYAQKAIYFCTFTCWSKLEQHSKVLHT